MIVNKKCEKKNQSVKKDESSEQNGLLGDFGALMSSDRC